MRTKAGSPLRWARKNVHAILLVAVVAWAVFVRFYNLDGMPPGLHPDEAANGIDIFSILEKGNIQPFYEANGGREGLFFMLQAISVAIFGNTIAALRYAPAVIGVLSVLAMYAWTRSWYGKWVGLVAAYIMATLPWAITFSRLGFRASMIMLMLPLTLWLLTRAAQTKRAGWAIAAGVSLGAGFYTYLAWRLIPIALVIIGVYWLIRLRKRVLEWLRPAAITAVATVVVLVPMGLYAVQNPEALMARSSVSIFNPDLNGGNLPATFAAVTGKMALMYNVSGDQNFRHNLGGEPQLNIFVGIVFLLGLLVCLVQIKRWRSVTLLALMFAMLLPALLTAEGIPHALRAVGTLPVAVILAAVGTQRLLRTWRGIFPLNPAARQLGLGAILLLLGLSGVHGYTQYHIAHANAPQTYDAFSEPAVEMARELVNVPFNGQNFVYIDGYSDTTVQYITHNKAWYQRLESPSDVDKLPVSKEAKRILIVDGEKARALDALKRKYPNGKVQPHYSRFSERELFVSYIVPAS